MNYFEEDHYFKEIDPHIEFVEEICVELKYTDEQFYRNINTILRTPNVTSISIRFSDDEPLQEDVLALLSHVKTLEKLELSFENSDITTIPEVIFEITSLKILSISHIEANELPSAIGKLKNLEELTLNGTSISTLPDSILKLTKLRVLDLEVNAITLLPSSIGKLKELRNINLFLNALKEIPKSICDLENLEELHIDNNDIALVTSVNVTILKAKKPHLKLMMTELDSQEYKEQVRFEEICSLVNRLDTTNLIFDNNDDLYNACKEIIGQEFSFGDDIDFDRYSVDTLRHLLLSK